MPLPFAPEQQILIVESIDGGQDIKRRLSEMGMYIGAEVELVQSSGAGPVMIRLGGSKIAIGRGMAQKINVTVKAS